MVRFIDIFHRVYQNFKFQGPVSVVSHPNPVNQRKTQSTNYRFFNFCSFFVIILSVIDQKLCVPVETFYSHPEIVNQRKTLAIFNPLFPRERSQAFPNFHKLLISYKTGNSPAQLIQPTQFYSLLQMINCKRAITDRNSNGDD